MYANTNVLFQIEPNSQFYSREVVNSPSQTSTSPWNYVGHRSRSLDEYTLVWIEAGLLFFSGFCLIGWYMEVCHVTFYLHKCIMSVVVPHSQL